MSTIATHLLVRSSYSLLKGTMDNKKIISKAKELGFNAVALSDFHVLHGALDFQLEAEKQAMKPIFGLEVTFNDFGTPFHSLLIAKNNNGFQHLMRISLLLSENGSINLDSAISDDIFLLIFSENGPFEHYILGNQWDKVLEIILDLKQKFSSNLYLGISHQESSYFKKMNEKLIEMGSLNTIKSVALSKVYYENVNDDETYRVLSAIEKGTYLEDKTLVSAPNRQFYSMSEMNEIYDSSLLKMSDDIASQCHVDLKSLTTTLPVFPSPHAVSNKVYLSELAHFGLKRRRNNLVDQVSYDRLEYELSVINSMNFSDYFLIVYDVIRYAKRNGVYVGPGRGSAAGSLVAYALGITEVDPIEFDLLFERFLNPERISMPDIDIDFPDDKRQFVIDYVREKYGDEHVAHIVTFGTMRARQAFRDVGRVLQVPIRTVDAASKLIQHTYLRDNYVDKSRFKAMIDGNELLTRCFELALKIEGLPRHASIHAAGVVLSSKPLIDVVPLMRLSDDSSSIQYDMTNIERIGLIKIDFLGLRNLSIVDNISSQIPNFSIDEIPYNDKKTFDLIAKGQTVGLFQLESEGMTQLLVKMKPNRFMDIVDTIALYRPGPMENIPLYLKNRQNPKGVQYLHKDLEVLTKDTNGILIYQEQIMLVAQRMAGFSLGRADILRKAMSKKDAKELDGLSREFIDGAIQKGYTEEFAHELFNLVQRFANYGFNKSHSVAYAKIAYQMAYLKANQPYLFYTHLLTSVIGSNHKTAQYLDECRKRNILVLSPNLEKSLSTYSLEGLKIRIPFTIIKGISDTISSIIIDEREHNGSYKSFYDAIARLSVVGLKNNHFKVLIQAGAFDYFGINRLSALASLDEALRYANIISVQKDGRISLDASLVSEPVFVHVEENLRLELQEEYSVLGFYLSDHPAVHLKNKHKTESIINLEVGKKNVRIIAMIERVKLHRAKNGKQMAFLNISDETGTCDTVMFNNVFEKLEKPLVVGDLVLIKGEMREADSLIISDFYVFDH